MSPSATIVFLSILQSTSNLILTPCLNDSCSPCIVINGRAEVHQLSNQQRGLVASEFRVLRRQYNNTEWKALVSENICELYKRMDKILSPNKLLMPYWDSRIENRLSNPALSFIFNEQFFPRHRRRHARHQRKKLLEHRLRRHPDLVARAVRSSPNRQLLTVLRLTGAILQEYINETCQSMCPPSNALLYCSKDQTQSTSICLPRLSPSSPCMISDLNPCHRSLCLHGICSIGSSPSRSTTPSIRDRMVSTTVSRNLHTIDTATVVPNEPASTPSTTIAITQTSTHAHRRKQQRAATISSTSKAPKTIHLVLENEDDAESSGEESPTEIIEVAASESYSRVFYNLTDFEEELPLLSSTLEPFPTPEALPTETYSSTATTLSTTSPAPSTISTPISTAPSPLFHRKKIYRVPIRTRPSTTHHAFLSSLPFPSVYIPVTVIEGQYVRRSRQLTAAEGVVIYSKGANMPSGYTQTVQGTVFNSTDGIVRVLDPQLSGVLIEAAIIVKRDGKDCLQMCLTTKKAIYKPCARNTIRLSRYPEYSDPIEWYKNLNEAIDSQWIGAGYYRRRKQDYLLFTCPPRK